MTSYHWNSFLHLWIYQKWLNHPSTCMLNWSFLASAVSTGKSLRYQTKFSVAVCTSCKHCVWEDYDLSDMVWKCLKFLQILKNLIFSKNFGYCGSRFLQSKDVHFMKHLTHRFDVPIGCLIQNLRRKSEMRTSVCCCWFSLRSDTAHEQAFRDGIVMVPPVTVRDGYCDVRNCA